MSRDPQSDVRIKALIRENEIRDSREIPYIELARFFPALERAEGIDPLDAEKLDEWAASGQPSGALLAAQFILTLWHPTREWKCGRFDIGRIHVWDKHNRAAFLTWAANPTFRQ